MPVPKFVIREKGCKQQQQQQHSRCDLAKETVLPVGPFLSTVPILPVIHFSRGPGRLDEICFDGSGLIRSVRFGISFSVLVDGRWNC